MENIKRVHKKEIASALSQAKNIIRDLHQHFNESEMYKFTERLVDSAKWNIVLKGKDGFFDLDYKIFIAVFIQEESGYNIKSWNSI